MLAARTAVAMTVVGRSDTVDTVVAKQGAARMAALVEVRLVAAAVALARAAERGRMAVADVEMGSVEVGLAETAEKVARVVMAEMALMVAGPRAAQTRSRRAHRPYHTTRSSGAFAAHSHHRQCAHCSRPIRLSPTGWKAACHAWCRYRRYCQQCTGNHLGRNASTSRRELLATRPRAAAVRSAVSQAALEGRAAAIMAAVARLEVVLAVAEQVVMAESVEVAAVAVAVAREDHAVAATAATAISVAARVAAAISVAVTAAAASMVVLTATAQRAAA